MFYLIQEGEKIFEEVVVEKNGLYILTITVDSKTSGGKPAEIKAVFTPGVGNCPAFLTTGRPADM
jgi:hypothetical protein